MDALIVPLIALIVYLLTPPPAPTDHAVLLPEPDGKVGALVVKTAAGERVLDTAYAGLAVDSRGAMQAVQEDAASVRARYGAALDAQPPRAQSFTVHFVSGSATELAPESGPVLEALKSALAGRPAPEIMVIGHTDRVGKLEANDELSLKRAAGVRDLLVTAGIRAASLEVAGRGEREPLVPTADEVAEPRNRRVEISVR
jgi:outer membrane protein OmpA-like peptidoglycan-associated protein